MGSLVSHHLSVTKVIFPLTSKFIWGVKRMLVISRVTVKLGRVGGSEGFSGERKLGPDTTIKMPTMQR